MDVQSRLLRPILFLGLAFGFSACANKTANSVFPESTLLSESCRETAIKTEFLVTWEDGRISREYDHDAESFTSHFIEPQLKNIQHVEFNKKMRLHHKLQPTPEFSSMALNNWGQDLVEAASAWNQSIKGSGVLVAVTDTVIDLNHVQLASRIATNLAELNGTRGVDDDGNGFIDDIHGWDFLNKRPHELGKSRDSHGSHVAGIIAAEHGKGPINGMAPEAKILPVAFLSEDGEGDLFGAINSLDYAVASGAKIINASWGGPNCSESLREAFRRVSQAGVLAVVASGNDGKDLEMTPDYPAAFTSPTQITVAAIRSSGYMSRFSNTSYRFVNIAAPGEEIYSSVPASRYASMSGTSMAAPFVSGAAALLWSYRPNATALQIRSALLAGVDAGNYRVETQGRLNVRKALLALQTLLNP